MFTDKDFNINISYSLFDFKMRLKNMYQHITILHGLELCMYLSAFISTRGVVEE